MASLLPDHAPPLSLSSFFFCFFLLFVLILPLPLFVVRCLPLTVAAALFLSVAGVGEEAVESDAGDQGAEARPQHLCWRERGSSDQGGQGDALIPFPLCALLISRGP
ncbi:hypothetical protein Taro_008208 [Colocasia esculenta]|uniref:Uncharacterized protein n=1 Tax=Colocasia esculenta TaxID=4460 RepID=A0A843U163_COLES|nr:hypothetical protein [Colocasia esculenta]